MTLLENYTIVCPASGYLYMSIPTTQIVKNCKLYNGYFYVGATTVTSAYRLLQGFYIESPYAHDITMSSGTSDYHFNNVDNNRALNRKIVINITSRTGDVYFHRTGTLTIKNKSGVVIIGASVVFTDDHANVYSYVSDANGQVAYDIVEQYALHYNGVSGLSTNTYYEGWIISVTKAGYLAKTLKFDYAYQILNATAFLNAVPLRITSLSFSHPSRENDDGAITIGASDGTAPYEYSIDDGANYESGAVFSDLEVGTYTIKVRDDDGDVAGGITITLVMNGTELYISSVTFIHPTLLNNNGSIAIVGSGGVAPYTYSKDDGVNYQASGSFPGLAAGSYALKIKDAMDVTRGGITLLLVAPTFVTDQIEADIAEDISGEVDVDFQVT
jgi:hypothetical protein